MGLNGIDISSWQEDLVVSAMGTCDFVIVKATGGAGYSNECFHRHADETLAAGKLLDCYHYARDRWYEGSAEAARRNGSWVAVNCKKKRVATLDAFNTSLEVVPTLG